MTRTMSGWCKLIFVILFLSQSAAAFAQSQSSKGVTVTCFVPPMIEIASVSVPQSEVIAPRFVEPFTLAPRTELQMSLAGKSPVTIKTNLENGYTYREDTKIDNGSKIQLLTVTAF